MPSSSVCPSCGRAVRAPEGLRGSLLRCPRCALIFWATDGTAPAREAPPRAESSPPPAEDSRPPWERPGFVRRDCEPHRAGPLALLATVALIFGILSLCVCLPALIALPMGLGVYAAARRDLALMQAGQMDPDGSARTQTARDMALGGAFTAGMASLLWGWGAWMHWMS
ncbi:MAG TPA: hypothetical protein VFA26_11435 [Gemmataceae bacterium]|nr:hypothetical protein [Gemmataceae bacterium]